MSIAEKLTTVAENQEKVYEAGQKSAYDRFWDAYQQNGNRKNYAAAFGGEGWTNEWFQPKYDIICEGTCSQMFYGSYITGDLAEHLNSRGITLDLSKMTSAHSLFNAAVYITRLPEINITLCVSACSSLFANCRGLVTIDKLVVKDSNAFNGTFQNCTALKDLTIEGTVASAMDLHWSPLSGTSIQSVMNALSDTVTGATVTFKQTAVEAAFTDAEWEALVSTKPNWTVVLA